MEHTIEFSRTKKIGSSTFYMCENNRYFRKEKQGEEDLLKKEYENLLEVHGSTGIEGMRFIEPVEFSQGGLVSKYVDAESLIEKPLPHLYKAFGRVLREFHNSGYTHSHLQFNDVLYDGSEFYLTDLPYLNERDAIQDIVIPKIGLDSFKIKQPWRWKLYSRCFTEFLEGYGCIKHPNLQRAYDEVFRSKISNMTAVNTGWESRLKAHTLVTARRVGLIGPPSPSELECSSF